MAVNYHNIEFSYLAKEPSFRSDLSYLVPDIIVSQNDYYRFGDLFDVVYDDSVNIGELGIFEYAEIGNVSSSEDVSPILLDMDDQNELNACYFKKIKKGDIIKVHKDDILISKVRPYLKKIVFIDDSNCHIYYTSAFIHIHPRKCARILFYMLKGYFIHYVNSISRQGKGYPTLSEKDLNLMKFSKTKIDRVISNEFFLTSQISVFENKIRSLKENLISDEDIINEVLGNSFGWDYKTFSLQKLSRKYKIGFSDLSNNYDLRMSAKFHRPAGTFVYSDIEKTNCLRVKNFISAPITLGASVSPQDFDSSGVCYYISMATIKNYRVELDESQLLGDEYVKISKNAKKKVKKGDILMTRSGVAIGKFAVVEEDMNAIHSDFTMKIRLKNINRDFAYYYFRSIYFQYLIEINYKGLQNNNIFPNQIQEFPIPNISEECQQRIVENIKFKLEEQDKTKCEIEKLRLEIDKIVEAILAHSA